MLLEQLGASSCYMKASPDSLASVVNVSAPNAFLIWSCFLNDTVWDCIIDLLKHNLIQNIALNPLFALVGLCCNCVSLPDLATKKVSGQVAMQ